MDSSQTMQGQMGASDLIVGAVGAMEGQTQKRTMIHTGWPWNVGREGAGRGWEMRSLQNPAGDV